MPSPSRFVINPAAFNGLELLATAIVLLDGNLRVNYANPAAEAVFALSMRSILGQSFPALFLDSGALDAQLRQALREERGFADPDLVLVPIGQEPLHLS